MFDLIENVFFLRTLFFFLEFSATINTNKLIIFFSNFDKSNNIRIERQKTIEQKRSLKKLNVTYSC